MELGQPAWAYMNVLVHVSPDGRWEEPCTELCKLLREHGAEQLHAAFDRCVIRKRFSVDAVPVAMRKRRVNIVNIYLAAVIKRLSLAMVAGCCSSTRLAPPLKAEEVAHRTNTRVNEIARGARRRKRASGVVDQRCLKRKPLIFSTNKRLKDWGAVLHDEKLAEALRDRVLERGQHISMGGGQANSTGSYVYRDGGSFLPADQPASATTETRAVVATRRSFAAGARHPRRAGHVPGAGAGVRKTKR